MRPKKEIQIVAGVVLFGLSFLYLMYDTFSNPELTRAQLLVRQWWVALPLLIGAALMIKWYKK
jgi:hypothetical protein